MMTMMNTIVTCVRNVAVYYDDFCRGGWYAEFREFVTRMYHG